MMDNPLVRRALTISAVVLAFLVATPIIVPLLALGLIIDLMRSAGGGRPTTVRLLAFGWVYLLGEIWALIALGSSAMMGRRKSIEATYRLQERWTSWNFAALGRIFSMSFEVTGDDRLAPGPIIVLSRHVSIIDTLLPAVLISRGHGIRLRYVLKKELLIDPALDIAGNRLPNHFIDRGAGESESDRSAIRELATGLSPGEGILIYPEGTRFTEEKRDRHVSRWEGKGGRLARMAGGFRHVLPPRPGGTLAILEGSDADIVVLSHRGLEGLATVRDIWSGRPVGSHVEVRFERISRRDVPTGRSERVEWLFGVWESIDTWVGER